MPVKTIRNKPELVRQKLHSKAIRYLQINEEIDELTREKAEIRRVGLQALAVLNERSVVYPNVNGDLKAQRYEVVTAEYDVEKLLSLQVEDRDLPPLTKIVPDEKAIDRAVENGLVTMDQLKRVARRIDKSWRFRVDRSKRNAEEA